MQATPHMSEVLIVWAEMLKCALLACGTWSQTQVERGVWCQVATQLWDQADNFAISSNGLSLTVGIAFDTCNDQQPCVEPPADLMGASGQNHVNLKMP